MIRSAASFAACAICLAAQPAFAQEVAPIPFDANSFSIGAGVGFVPSYEGSDDYSIIPAAVVRGRVAGHNFYTRGLQLYVDAIPEADGQDIDFSLGPVAAVRLDRTSGIEDAQVRALGKLDTAVELGGFAGISKTGVITSDYDTLGVRVAYLTDVAGAHGSHVIIPSIEYGTPLSRFSYIGVGASAEFVGDGFASYYYDVTPVGSLASGLTPFQADGGFKSWSVNIGGAHALTGDLLSGLSLFAVTSYSRLQGDFARSPIVSEAGSRNQWFGALGLAYSF